MSEFNIYLGKDCVMNNLKAINSTVISYLSKLIFFDQNSDSDDSDQEIELYLHRSKVSVTNLATKPHRIESFIERVIDVSITFEFQRYFKITVTSFQWLLNRIAPLLKSARAAGN